MNSLAGLSTRQFDLITFGDTCVDLLLSGGDVVPRFGQVEQLVGDYTLEMGGSACLFACQAAKLGLRVGILGKVGDDNFGSLVLQRLRECGVDVSHLKREPGLKTGLGVALCKDNDRAILTYPGSLDSLHPHDVPSAFLSSARHIHHGSFFLLGKLQPAVPAIFYQAKAAGLSTSLDTNWDPDECWSGSLWATLAHTDIFLPNQQELRQITGETQLQAGIQRIHAAGVKVVVVKSGDTGACLSDGTTILHCQVSPVTGGDSVGAGDSFDAGFLAGWLRGMPWADCLRLACGCGRSVARKIGGLAGQLDWCSLVNGIDDLEVR